MPCPSLKEVLIAMEQDGVAVEKPSKSQSSWIRAAIEGPDPKLSRSVLIGYRSKHCELSLWTELQPACPVAKFSPDTYLAMLCFNRKLYGSVLALEDGSLYYKSLSRIITKPKDYRPLVALTLTEATLIEEALKQIEQTRKNPLVVVEQMPNQTDYIDILRKGQSTEGK